jgi:aminopeptidase N
MFRCLSFAALACTLSCTSVRRLEFTPKLREIPMDVHSHAEPNRVRVTHVSLDLELDFERQRADGSVHLEFKRPDPKAPLLLDAYALEIVEVSGASGSPREFELSPEDPTLGSALRIELEAPDRSVTIRYRTTERTQAMQWLAPEQTAGGKQPFLFTQGQSILTRSWIPLQDSPGIRVTYDARIRAPQALTPVMSAEHLGRGADGSFRFRMTQPIPSYLIALACGELEYRAISPRCGVWAEPPVAGPARDELSDTESMIANAERLFGPYRWGRYDLLILPPSFPFGGMENPRLTFATPTILAGDKSLVSLVAHELAHSWSGNLVTNATWSDFWLNEGFTVYLEQRIMEQVFGAERSAMEKQLALRDLENEMQTLEPWQQSLYCGLEGKNPDDGFTSVPYEKGALFLRRIEQLVGRKDFDRFLNRYFDEHAFESITTESFLAYLALQLLDDRREAAKGLDIGAWVFQPGLPDDAPRPRSEALVAVDREIERWKSGTTPQTLETGGWVTQQWLHFLEGLPETTDSAQMAALDAAFRFTDSGNSEIVSAWLILSIKRGYAGADAKLESFLTTIGRRKFLKPIYTELAKTDAGLTRARAIYAKARPHYHAISRATIDAILTWNP